MVRAGWGWVGLHLKDLLDLGGDYDAACLERQEQDEEEGEQDAPHSLLRCRQLYGTDGEREKKEKRKKKKVCFLCWVRA